MKLHGVINASPDSLADFSIAETVDEAVERATLLISQGCVGIDLGGAGSTQFAERVELEQEWDRLDGKIQAIAELGVELSVDTWQPEIMERALDAGANFMNAADGLQNPDMVALAADRGVPVVLPFLSGVDPKAMSFVEGEPMDVMLPWFQDTLARVTSAGVAESQIIIDPGTGFGPADWNWEDRRRYQDSVYSQLDRLRVFGMPIYMALPWKFDGGRLELLDTLLRVGFDYGRAHLPDYILQRHQELGLADTLQGPLTAFRPVEGGRARLHMVNPDDVGRELSRGYVFESLTDQIETSAHIGAKQICLTEIDLLAPSPAADSSAVVTVLTPISPRIGASRTEPDDVVLEELRAKIAERSARASPHIRLRRSGSSLASCRVAL